MKIFLELEDELSGCLDYPIISNQLVHSNSSNASSISGQNQLPNSTSLDNLSNHNLAHQSRLIKLEKEEPRFNTKHHQASTNLNAPNSAANLANCLAKQSARQQLTSSNLYASQSDHLSNLSASQQQQLSSLYLVNPNNLIANGEPFYSSQSSNYPSTQNYTSNTNPSYTSAKYMTTIQPPPAHHQNNINNINVNQTISQSIVNALQHAAQVNSANINHLNNLNYLFGGPNNNIPAHIQNTNNVTNHNNPLHQFQNVYGYNLGVNKNQPYQLLW